MAEQHQAVSILERPRPRSWSEVTPLSVVFKGLLATPGGTRAMLLLGAALIAALLATSILGWHAEAAFVGYGITLLIVLLVAPVLRDRLRLVEDGVRLRQRLERREERWRDYFDALPLAAYRASPSGRIVAANRRLLWLLDYPSAEHLLGRSVDGLWGDDRSRQRCLESLAASAELVDFDGLLRRADGSEIPVRQSLRVLLGDDGGVEGYDGFLEAAGPPSADTVTRPLKLVR